MRATDEYKRPPIPDTDLLRTVIAEMHEDQEKLVDLFARYRERVTTTIDDTTLDPVQKRYMVHRINKSAERQIEGIG